MGKWTGTWDMEKLLTGQGGWGCWRLGLRTGHGDGNLLSKELGTGAGD